MKKPDLNIGKEVEGLHKMLEKELHFSGDSPNIDFLISALTEHRVWRYFTTGFFIVPIALLLLIYVTIKEKSAEKVLLIVWSTIMLLAMLGQVRFAYYFAVNVALLMGYFRWRIPGWIMSILDWIGFKEPSPDNKKREKV